MIRLVVAAALLAALAGTTAHADVLHLENGGRVEGVVTVEGDYYIVRMLSGTARIPAKKVVHRVSIPYVTEVYERRRDAIDESNPKEQFRLAMWCLGKGLKERARRHLDRVIALDPDHAEARSIRGEVKVDGVWVEREVARELRMARAGFIRFEGKWFTEEGLSAYLEAKAEMQKLEAVAEKRRLEREAAERKAREEEERIAKLAAERKAVEAALKRAEEDRAAMDRLIRENQRLLDWLRDPSYCGYGYGYGYGDWWPYGSPYRSRASRLSGAGQRRGSSRGLIGPRLEFNWHRGNLRIRGVVR